MSRKFPENVLGRNLELYVQANPNFHFVRILKKRFIFTLLLFFLYKSIQPIQKPRKIERVNKTNGNQHQSTDVYQKNIDLKPKKLYII